MFNETLSMAPFMNKQETLQDMAKTMAMIPAHFGKCLTMDQKLYILDLLMRYRDNSDKQIAVELGSKAQQDIAHSLSGLNDIADALRSLTNAVHCQGDL